MSKRRLHVVVELSGGCSLLLQTHFRQSAADYDLRFFEATHKSKGNLPSSQVFELHNAFFGDSVQSSHLDKSYLKVAHLQSLDESGAVPFMSITDRAGSGVMIYLASLEKIFWGKLEQLDTRVAMRRSSDLARRFRAFAAKNPMPPEWAEFFKEGPLDLAKNRRKRFAKQNRDGYALGVILNRKWPGPVLRRVSRLTTQAQRGRKIITFRTVSL